MIRAGLFGVMIVALLSGCGRDYGMRCEDPERYSGGLEVPPVRVPDDLSVPDESQALRIPQVARSREQAAGRGPCLESPPSYAAGAEGEQAPETADAE